MEEQFILLILAKYFYFGNTKKKKKKSKAIRSLINSQWECKLAQPLTLESNLAMHSHIEEGPTALTIFSYFLYPSWPP